MGEYAERISDGEEVKIGTCESMYYLRFEDRNKVRHVSGNVNPSRDSEAGQLLFRLPFPDEDGVLIGEYDPPERGLRLWRELPCAWCKGSGGDCQRCKGKGHDGTEDFADPETVSDPGIIQLHNDSGILVNLPCYHGHQLPELGGGAKAFWNGKSWHLELAWVRAVYETGRLHLFPVVHCRFCGHAWRYQWADILPFVHGDILPRLQAYAETLC